jgi:hypothetical protein
MATDEDVLVLRSEDMPTLRSRPSITPDDARESRPPRNVLRVTAEILDPPQPIKRSPS